MKRAKIVDPEAKKFEGDNISFRLAICNGCNKLRKEIVMSRGYCVACCRKNHWPFRRGA